MQCEEFEDRLNDSLDSRASGEADPELHLHSQSCSGCRALAAAYDKLMRGFHVLKTPLASSDMAARVVGEMLVEPRRQLSAAHLNDTAHVRGGASSRRTALAGAALAIAATLLIAVMPLLKSPTTVQPQADALATRDAVARAKLELANLPMVPELLAIGRDEDGDAAAELAKETGQGLASVVLHVPGIGGARGMIDVDASALADEPAWIVQMSEGIKPIADSVTETLSLLWQSLPVSDLVSRS